jgi:hypothetical protein
MTAVEKNSKLINEENELALHSAIIAGDKITTISFLEQDNAIIDKADKQGNTPLHLATLNNHHEIISVLINSSASTIIRNSEGKTALQIAQQLNHERCVELLLENEAIFSNKISVQNKEGNLHDRAKELVKQLEKLVTDSIAKKVSKKEFFKTTCTMMATKFNLSEINFDDQKLLEIMGKNFELIKILSTEQNLITKYHKTLGIVRKTIAGIGDFCMKNLQKNHTSEIYFISKAESLIEEAIVRAKTTQLVKSNNSLKPRLDRYKENKHGGVEEFKSKAKKGKNNSIIYLSYLESLKEKILCKVSDNKMCFLDSVKIMPLDIVSKEEAQKLFALSSKRLEAEGIKNKVELLLSAESLSTNDLKTLDNLMRPGKAEGIHVINFIPITTTYDDHWTDITEQAFITGAIIHCFNYNDIRDNNGSIVKNDLIYNGIAMVNKLLDDGIHPDKIILQGYCSGIDIAIEVVKQFLITGNIELTHFSYSTNKSVQGVGNNSINKPKKELSKNAIFDLELANVFERTGPRRLRAYADEKNKKVEKLANKISTKNHLDDCPEDFVEARNFLEREASGLRLAPYAKCKAAHNWQLKDIETTSGMPYFQLLNYFISNAQKLFTERPELKNPCLPKERVEHIHNDMSLIKIIASKMTKQDSSCVCKEFAINIIT